MFRPKISKVQVEQGRRFLEELSAAPNPPGDTDLKAAQAKQVELVRELETIQRDGGLPLEEAASRIVLLRTQLEILGGRIATLEQALSKAEQERMARAAATRKNAAEFVINVAYDVRDQARMAVEEALRPWYRGQPPTEKTVANIPFVAAISDRIQAIVRFGMLDDELLHRLQKLFDGGDFLGLDPGSPELDVTASTP